MVISGLVVGQTVLPLSRNATSAAAVVAVDAGSGIDSRGCCRG